MNTESSTTDNKKPRIVTVSLWISIWAVIISIGCLFIGFSAQSKVGHSERRLQRNVELLNESRQQIETLDKKVQDELDRNQQIVEQLRFSIDRNENRIRRNSQTLETTREVASQLIDSLTEQREALEAYSEELQLFVQRFEGTTPPVPEVAVTAEADPPSPAEEATPTPEPTEEQRREYIVRSGDTLSQIARRTGFSVPELLDANPDINPNLIRVGQTLQLPEN